MQNSNRAVLTVLGRDAVGIIAKVSAILSQHDVNILDISQTVLSSLFHMVMVVDLQEADFSALAGELTELGAVLGLQVRIQRSEIFDAMHRI